MEAGECNTRQLIKNVMKEMNFSIKNLSARTNINVLIITYLLFVPFSKIKLTQWVRISKALGLDINKIT